MTTALYVLAGVIGAGVVVITGVLVVLVIDARAYRRRGDDR